MKDFIKHIRFILISIVLLLCFQVRATHIVGGELYYDCLGNNNYRITLKAYRDCINGQAPFDDPVSIGVFLSNGALYQNILIALPGYKTLPATLKSPCFVPPSNVCVEEAIYDTVVNLPPTPGGYTLSYQRCCRNSTILNIYRPDTAGATYVTQIPDPSVVSCNSSPRFNEYPPIFLCANMPFTFDHSATDPDGDSLVYELCAPYHGGNQGVPRPSPPSPPPYYDVSFKPPYNGSNPLSASPPLVVNPQTGELTATPNLIGQFVVGVCVREYRNGVFVGVSKRDFQFNVANCNAVQPASFPSQTTFCTGKTVQFKNLSKNGLTYHWDFGETPAVNDTSNVFEPNFTYADTGVYTVTLIVNPGWPCADTAISTFEIYPPINPTFTKPAQQCITNNTFSFNGQGGYSPTATYAWNFGVGANPLTANQQNPSGISYSTPGAHLVTLTITEKKCVKSYTDTVKILAQSVANIPQQQSFCKGLTVAFSNTSTNAINYHWDFGVSNQLSDTSNLSSPTFTFPDTGTYKVTLITNKDITCSDTATTTFTVYPPLVPSFNKQLAQCVKNNSFAFNGSGGITTTPNYAWSFPGANVTSSNIQNPSGIVYASPGTYPVTLTVTDKVCTEVFTDSVQIDVQPLSDFPAQTDSCFGYSVQFTNQSSSATHYHWDFGVSNISNDTSALQDPSYLFPDTGIFNVSLISFNGTCRDTQQVKYAIYPPVNASFATPPGQCVKNNEFSFSGLGAFSANGIYQWDFSSPSVNLQSSSLQNPSGITYSTHGTYPVKLLVSDHGCIATYSDSVVVYPMPLSSFNFPPVQGCTPLVVNFTDTINNFPGMLFIWNFGDGNSASTLNASHTFNETGVFDISHTVISTIGCTDTSVFTIPQVIAVERSPKAFFSFENSPLVDISDPRISILDKSADAVTCKVYFGDGDSSDICTIEHTYKDTGTYRVKQVVTNAFGCVDVYYIDVIVEANFYFYAPNAFTPNGDGKNDVFMPLLTNGKDFKLTIFDRWGMEIYNTTDMYRGWNGIPEGATKKAQEDVYVWLVEFKDITHEQATHHFIGHVSLLR